MKAITDIFFSPNRKLKDTIRSLEEYAMSGSKPPRLLSTDEISDIVAYISHPPLTPRETLKPVDPKIIKKTT